VAAELQSKGFTHVYALKDGWDAWQKAGHPTEKK
jgi:rhodanese-related sulfurtransferase